MISRKLSLNSNKLLSKSMAGILFKALNTVMLFTTNIIVARGLGEQGFGEYSLLLTLLTVAMVFYQFGFPNFIIRSEKYVDNESKNDTYSFNVLISGLLLATSLVGITFLLLVLEMAGLFRLPASFDTIQILKTIAASYLGACILLINSYLRSQGLSLSSISTDQLIVPLFILSGVLFYTTTSGLTIDYVLNVYLLSYGLGSVVLFVWVKRSGYIKITDRSKIRESFYSANIYLKMCVFTLCFILLNHLPILILAGSDEVNSVPAFRVSYLLALPLLLIAYPINILAGPHISHAYQSQDYSYLKLQLVAVVRLITFLGLIYSVIIVFLGNYIIEEIFQFKNDNFRILVILILLNNLLAVAFGPVGLILNMVGSEGYVLKVIVVSVLFSVIGMWTLVDHVGVLGLAAIGLVITFGWKYLLLKKVKRDTGVDCSVVSNHGNLTDE